MVGIEINSNGGNVNYIKESTLKKVSTDLLKNNKMNKNKYVIYTRSFVMVGKNSPDFFVPFFFLHFFFAFRTYTIGRIQNLTYKKRTKKSI